MSRKLKSTKAHKYSRNAYLVLFTTKKVIERKIRFEGYSHETDL